MKELNQLLSEIGISKVKLAKYLGVSRQMIYNYLELDSLSKWPQEKRILLLKLLDIEDDSDKAIKNIKITSEYLENVEARLNQNVRDMNSQAFNYKNLTREEQDLLNDLVFLIKEKFAEEKTKETYWIFLYLYHVLQSLDNVQEIKYIFASEIFPKKSSFTSKNPITIPIFRSFKIQFFNIFQNGFSRTITII